MLLENDLFLSKLTLMFDKSRSKGHVDLNMKRYDGRTKPTPKPRKNVKQKGKKNHVGDIAYFVPLLKIKLSSCIYFILKKVFLLLVLNLKRKSNIHVQFELLQM